MCGRYGFTTSKEEIAQRFNIEKVNIELNNNYNVAPTQEMPVIQKHSPNSISLKVWGIQPAWSNMYLINAQSSKLSTSSVWKKAYAENRCIIPANYFFEWKKTEEGKEPYLIKLKSNSVFGFAGLIVDYKDKAGKNQEGYVIITTHPNSIMADIHNRMPVILKKEDEENWLNPDISEFDVLDKMLISFPSEEMTAFKISTLVNSPKNNFPEILKPV